jgi:hypothetical protein
MAKILHLNVATWEDADRWLLGWVWRMLLDCDGGQVLLLDPGFFVYLDK